MSFVRHIKTGVLYRFIGGNVFENTITKQRGTVDDEMVQKIFKINLEATALIGEYPLLEDFISSLGLKVDGDGMVSGR